MSTRRVAKALAQPASLSSARKACRILRAVAASSGPRLTDIAGATELDKATVLRLLEMLSDEGFTIRDPSSKRYELGPEMQAVGAAALSHFDPRPLTQPSLLRLAAKFDDTILLSVPSGHESLCLAVEEGKFPIRANYLSVGGRRLLGVGAGSLALLAALPEREYDAVIPAIRAALRTHPRLTGRLVEQKVIETRELGYAITLDLVVDRMGGVGVPLMGGDGRPLAALSIAALSDRIVARRDEIVEALKREAAVCSAAWGRALRRQRSPG